MPDPTLTASESVSALHPAVKLWFERRFPHGPTLPQAEGWPKVAAGVDTLIAAPTGSGKTLTGFLICIDRLYRQHEAGTLAEPRTQVVYVSPLKALTVDIHKNLELPLLEIAETARELGFSPPEIRVLARSGDTPQKDRARMLTHPPHFLITTPESLYLLVTSERSRELLRDVNTVIVDEIHAVARDKRGSHLALTLARLAHVCHTPPQFIGLSATQKPLDVIARLLVGTEARAVKTAIVNVGHQRALDLAIDIPDSELEAVASHEQIAEVLDKIAAEVKSRRTTLIFVNTRRLSERLAHLLAERLGPERVAAHHGSLSKERRLAIEDRLRAGELSALVATASLELGLDVGPVELVCQIGSPRSIATFLQRVGRSGHSRFGTPVGRLYPLTRDELVECVALMRAVRGGRLDAIRPPVCPLDILAQHIIAECACEEWDEEALFQLVRSASPFASLTREVYESILELVTEGVITGRGTRADYVKRDRIHKKLTGRRGARLAALTSGGAIPENADYRVVADPDDTFVGTINEDFAIESMAGDVFLLGSTSWRIRRVERGIVRVVDAQGASPTIPFWLGEAPARSFELSAEVSALRTRVTELLELGAASGRTWLKPLCPELMAECGISEKVALAVLEYLSAVHAALGCLPTQKDLVFERFFDDTGGMQLVLHSPLGGRINRALGLLLRKRFCRSFDFELQAAASDDSILLSLGPQHSFPLEDLRDSLNPAGIDEALRQAVLATPMFGVRWRWNLNRFLLVLRFRGGKRNPPPLQRMEADDMMAAIFPSLAACQDNATGPRIIPSHPVVDQTLGDCMTEAMDLEGLRHTLEAIRAGTVRVHFRDTTEPSPLSHEILNSRPYTFLDDAPLEERRARAVQLRKGLPLHARELSSLDPAAIDRVKDEALPAPQNAEELHDWLESVVLLRENSEYSGLFSTLQERDRAHLVELRTVEGADGAVGAHGTKPVSGRFWCAAENADWVLKLEPTAQLIPAAGQGGYRSRELEAEAVAATLLRGHLELSGPVLLSDITELLGLAPSWVPIAVALLEREGSVLTGEFDPRLSGPQICSRRLLSRIHAYTRDSQRREIEPVTAQDFMRFLLEWQHVAPGTELLGTSGVLSAVAQLQGFETAVGAWEPALLAQRVKNYAPHYLDAAALAGDVVWGRLSVRRLASIRGANLSRATPITLALRADLPWLLSAVRHQQVAATVITGELPRILACLAEHGALFKDELSRVSGLLPSQLQDALWDGVARGALTADGFAALRDLSAARHHFRPERGPFRRSGLRQGMSAILGRQGPGISGISGREGRWTLFGGTTPLRPTQHNSLPHNSLPHHTAALDAEQADALAEAVADQLLARYGVVFRDLIARESFSIPWRDVLWAFRRLEARGQVRGGRFVTGFVGEQYALPEAVTALRNIRRRERDGTIVRVSSCDPLNLVGIITPGARVIPARNRTITYRDGLPVSLPLTTEARPIEDPPTRRYRFEHRHIKDHRIETQHSGISEAQHPNTQHSEAQHPNTQHSEAQHPNTQHSEPRLLRPVRSAANSAGRRRRR
ncbi:MAG: DEAD/DEAH box helicase [Polyangiaceae bacterium]|nr:DEAD/DEAH box helicase [Polyangiaceae bacterium]